MSPTEGPLASVPREIDRAADRLARAAAVPGGAERAAGVEVGQTPSEVIYRENKLELLRYEPTVPVTEEIPILVVYALINRPYILDLQPDRSVVRSLQDAGFAVYLIDWHEPSPLDRSLGLADYVDRYVANCVDAVRRDAGVPAVNLLGYCMGGTLSAIYTARRPATVNALGLLAAGLCFDGEAGVLELWGDEAYFDPGAVAETYDNVPAEFLDVGFALMDPVENLFGKYARLADNLGDEEFVENFARMETWLGDGIDVAGAVYEEYLTELYQENSLAEDELVLDGERVELSAIDVPLLQIVGEYDHLVPPASSVPFNELVGSEDTEAIQFPTGHVGLSVSSRSHAELWPAVGDWFADRSPDGASARDESQADASARDESQAGTSGREVTRAEPSPGDDGDGVAGPASDSHRRISGIGPTYGEQLSEAGYGTVGDLAAADPAAVAAVVDAAPSRVERWIGRARERLADAGGGGSEADAEGNGEGDGDGDGDRENEPAREG